MSALLTLPGNEAQQLGAGTNGARLAGAMRKN